MTPPARMGDGTDVSFKGISEVRKGDGTVLWSAIPDSAVARWELEQDYTDSWNGYDASTNGGPTFTTDSAVGTYASEVDGTDDRINYGSISETEGVSEVSIGVWVKPRTFASNNSVAFGAFPNTDDSIFLGVYQGGDYYFRVENGGTKTQYIGGAPSTGTYEHWVLTFNSGTGTFYIDGSEVASDSSGPSTTSSAHDDFYSGYSGEEDNFFDAIVDDPRIYSKELTAEEVSNWYNTGDVDG